VLCKQFRNCVCINSRVIYLFRTVVFFFPPIIYPSLPTYLKIKKKEFGFRREKLICLLMLL